MVVLSTAYSEEWYVSKQRGDDNNDGTKEHPFSTINRAYRKSTNGDTIFIEPAVYSEVNTITKSIKIKGLGGRPLVSGSFIFRDNVNVELSDLNMENTVQHLISGQRIESITINNVNLGPKYLKQGNAVHFHFTKMVELSNVKIIEADVGINLGDSNFKFKNIHVSKSKIGISINQRCKGTMEDSTITLCQGNTNLIGAGIYTGGDFTLKNVDIINNHASTFRKTGGGFYCFGGGLNIYGGKVIGNKAVYGAAGECTPQCSFFTSGTEFKDNENEYPSKCRGIPSSKK
eukprot:gene4067-7356_t